MATFWHSNFAAGFLALCLPVAAVGFLAARAKIMALGWGVLTALMTAVLVTTGSRAGVLAAGMGLLTTFVLALLARVRLPWARIGVTPVAVLLLVFVFRGSIVGRIGQNVDRRTGIDVYRAWT